LGPAPAAARTPSKEMAASLQQRLPPGYRIASGGLLPEGPNAGVLYGLPDTTGNTPLSFMSYKEFEQRVPEWRRWQLLAVAYVLLPASVAPDRGMIAVMSGDPALYLLSDPYPPARLLHEAVQAEGEAMWQQLASDAYDPRWQTVVAPSQQLALAPAVSPESIAIRSWQPEEILAEANVSAPALAVFSQTAYPGWRASVDGRRVRWLLCDGLFIGVPLEPGEHTIRLEYRPPVFCAGAAISLLSLGIVLTIAMAPRGEKLP